MNPQPDLPNVLLVIGKGRSGSTLVDTVLGQVDGVISTGELIHLWDWGLRDEVLCGCGQSVTQCDLWRKVMAKDLARHQEPPLTNYECVNRLQSKVHSWIHLPRVLWGNKQRWQSWRELSEIYARVYSSIRSVTGANLIVDSSKLPFYLPAVQPREVQATLVHLVRDPRAVVHSWRRSKRWTDRPHGEMPRFGFLYTVMSWIARNVVAEMILRKHRPSHTLMIKYEDFVQEPRRHAQAILDLAGLGLVAPEIKDGSIRLRVTHTVGGNPVRMETGHVEIRADNDFVKEMSAWTWAAVTILTLPLLIRYGYPVRRPTSESHSRIRPKRESR